MSYHKNTLFIVLGNQLFNLKYIPKDYHDAYFFMAEDVQLCTHFKYHKHKLIHFLASMRHYFDDLKAHNMKGNYYKLNDVDSSYLDKLDHEITTQNIKQIVCFEIEDHFFERKLHSFCKEKNIDLTVLQSPMFVTSRAQFSHYLESEKKPFMKTFYISQRKRLEILVDENLKPIGGKWSFDEENRKKLPKDHQCPITIDKLFSSSHIDDVKSIVQEQFTDHPGDVKNFWIACTQQQAQNWLHTFIASRFKLFGDYEDAMSIENETLYHSLLSPLLNIGLLTPKDILDEIQLVKDKIPLNSYEGFVRQVIGWREFIRGIYRHFDDVQQEKNFFNHKRKLSSAWYEGTTGVRIVDDCIKKAIKYGYCHHIERLMVLSNVMLLCEVHPQEVYKWFMELFVDSSDWVMGPNVFGMGQFSDGGIFATKPYICGSNYMLKMSDYKKEPWCLTLDGLYWRFINKHRDFFSKNPRMRLSIGSYDRFSPEKKQTLNKVATQFIEHVTHV